MTFNETSYYNKYKASVSTLEKIVSQWDYYSFIPAILHPLLLKQENDLTNNQYVPPILHQIWMNKDNEFQSYPKIPAKYIYYYHSWRKNNPNYYHIIWDGYMMNMFVKEYYPNFYNIYIEYPSWIYRCDTFRYLVLHKFGGIYVDMDFISIKPLPKWKHKVTLFSDCKPNVDYCGINNCLLVSEPNNIFWLNVLEESKKRFYENRDRNIVEVTGPNLLNDIQKTKDIYIETNECLFFLHHYNDRDNQLVPEIRDCTIGFHLWDFTWKDDVNKINENMTLDKIKEGFSTIPNIDNDKNNTYYSKYYDTNKNINSDDNKVTTYVIDELTKQLLKNIEYNIHNIDVNNYDFIIIGSGLYGLLLAKCLSKTKKVLIIEAGDFNIMGHVSEINENFQYPTKEENFWIIPHQGVFLQDIQTPLPYALGGRSVYWGGWANIPTKENLKGLTNEFINNFYSYLKKASDILNLTTIDKPNWIKQSENKNDIHSAQFSLLNGYPLCLIHETLYNKNIKILVNTKIIKLIPGNHNNIRGLHTTQGYLDVRKNNVILGAGTFENTNLLMRSYVTYNNNLVDLGKNLKDHNLTIYKFKIPKKDNINIENSPFIIKPYYFCYIQCSVDKEDENYLFFTMRGFVSVVSVCSLRNLTYNEHISNNDGTYKMLINFSLLHEDLQRWELMDKYMYNFLKNFNNTEIIDVKDENIIYKFDYTESQFFVLMGRTRQPLLRSFHECGTTPYGSVVDINSRVKNMNNLFIVGPSVIPSIDGCSPCIFTTCMLLRLKDYLINNTHTTSVNLPLLSFNKNNLELFGDGIFDYSNNKLYMNTKSSEIGLVMINKKLPEEYKVKCIVNNIKKYTNSGILLNFPNPNLFEEYKNKSWVAFDKGVEIQINSQSNSLTNYGAFYNKYESYYSRPDIKTDGNIFEIVVIRDMIIVYINNKLSSYSKYSLSNLFSKFIGFQIHTEDIIFQNITIENLMDRILD
jgi:mannosyltransferase OCH1-like enzyme